ncbi:MAG: DUF533 domain-containing protein [Rhodospirillales bacterium]
MFNARDLLGKLMDAGMATSAGSRVGHAMGPSGLAGGNSPLADLFSQITGSFGQNQGLSDFAGRAEDLMGQATGAVKSGNPLAIGGLAALAGAALGGRGGAVGGGLLALLGSLAYSALNKGGQAQQAGEVDVKDAPLGLREPQSPEEEKELESNASLIMRAMINAAKADGEIDDKERARILGKLDEQGASEEERRFVETEMNKPRDIAALAGQAVGSPDVAVQVYAASLLAIDVDTQAEEDYLLQLAAQLNLDATTCRQIHQALGVKRPAPV